MVLVDGCIYCMKDMYVIKMTISVGGGPCCFTNDMFLYCDFSPQDDQLFAEVVGHPPVSHGDQTVPP